MQKKLKNKIIKILFTAIAIVLVLTSTSFAETAQPTTNQAAQPTNQAVQSSSNQMASSQVESVAEPQPVATKSNTNQVSIPEKNIDTIKNLKKDSAKLKIVKFFMAMFGVLISAVFIWLGLKLYKKYLQNRVLSSNNTTYGDSLETPKDFKSALNLFLEKTDE